MLNFISIPNPNLALAAPVYGVTRDGKTLPVRVTAHSDRYEVDLFDGVWTGPVAETAIADGRGPLVAAIEAVLA